MIGHIRSSRKGEMATRLIQLSVRGREGDAFCRTHENGTR